MHTIKLRNKQLTCSLPSPKLVFSRIQKKEKKNHGYIPNLTFRQIHSINNNYHQKSTNIFIYFTLTQKGNDTIKTTFPQNMTYVKKT